MDNEGAHKNICQQSHDNPFFLFLTRLVLVKFLLQGSPVNADQYDHNEITKKFYKSSTRQSQKISGAGSASEEGYFGT